MDRIDNQVARDRLKNALVADKLQLIQDDPEWARDVLLGGFQGFSHMLDHDLVQWIDEGGLAGANDEVLQAVVMLGGRDEDIVAELGLNEDHLMLIDAGIRRLNRSVGDEMVAALRHRYFLDCLKQGG